MKKLAKMLLILVLLGLAAQAAPVLASLLVIVVMLHYATYAWQTIARIPARHRAELLVVAAIALGAGFLAKLAVAPLETRARIDRILEKSAPTADRLRESRAVGALEVIATPEAAQLLADLARGSKYAALTAEASVAA